MPMEMISTSTDIQFQSKNGLASLRPLSEEVFLEKHILKTLIFKSKMKKPLHPQILLFTLYT